MQRRNRTACWTGRDPAPTANAATYNGRASRRAAGSSRKQQAMPPSSMPKIETGRRTRPANRPPSVLPSASPPHVGAQHGARGMRRASEDQSEQAQGDHFEHQSGEPVTKRAPAGAIVSAQSAMECRQPRFGCRLSSVAYGSARSPVNIYGCGNGCGQARWRTADSKQRAEPMDVDFPVHDGSAQPRPPFPTVKLLVNSLLSCSDMRSWSNVRAVVGWRPVGVDPFRSPLGVGGCEHAILENQKSCPVLRGRCSGSCCRAAAGPRTGLAPGTGP